MTAVKSLPEIVDDVVSATRRLAEATEALATAEDRFTSRWSPGGWLDLVDAQRRVWREAAAVVDQHLLLHAAVQATGLVVVDG